MRPSYLYDGNPNILKTYFYWNGPPVSVREAGQQTARTSFEIPTTGPVD